MDNNDNDSIDSQQTLEQLEQLFLETVDESHIRPIRKSKKNKVLDAVRRLSISDFKDCLSNEPSSNNSSTVVDIYNFDDEYQDYDNIDILDIDDLINNKYQFEFLPMFQLNGI